MPKTRSVRLTDYQDQFIKKQGIGVSDFVRRAIDHYILYLQDPYTIAILIELEDWIQEKKSETRAKSADDVLHNNTNVIENNTNVIHDNTPVIHNNTDVLNINTQFREKQKNPHQNNIYHMLQAEIPVIKRILTNPANSDTIPDPTLKMLSKKYNISKSTIQGWIVENKEWIKTENFQKNKS